MSNTSPRSVAHDFARFEKIFGSKKTKQKNAKRASNANQNTPAAKRKSVHRELPGNEPKALNERKPLAQRIDNQSIDKVELLQYLSAQENKFDITEKTCQSDKDPSLDQISPDICDFSDEDAEKDARREQIAMTNQKLHEIRKSKLLYRPRNKVLQGGLLERISVLRAKRETKAVSFVRAKEKVEGQHRIEITLQSQFRKRVVLRFFFIDNQDDKLENKTRRFLVAPADFKLALKIQTNFDVIFDHPEQQISEDPQILLYFASSMIKAGQ